MIAAGPTLTSTFAMLLLASNASIPNLTPDTFPKSLTATLPFADAKMPMPPPDAEIFPDEEILAALKTATLAALEGVLLVVRLTPLKPSPLAVIWEDWSNSTTMKSEAVVALAILMNSPLEVFDEMVAACAR